MNFLGSYLKYLMDNRLAFILTWFACALLVIVSAVHLFSATIGPQLHEGEGVPFSWLGLSGFCILSFMMLRLLAKYRRCMRLETKLRVAVEAIDPFRVQSVSGSLESRQLETASAFLPHELQPDVHEYLALKREL
ncbi:MAG: hypothetical protein WC641_04490 [Patescibacteria group bacterium]